MNWKEEIEKNLAAMTEIAPAIQQRFPGMAPKLFSLISTGKQVLNTMDNELTQAAFNWLYNAKSFASNLENKGSDIAEYDEYEDEFDVASLLKYALAGVAIVGGLAVITPPLLNAARKRLN